MCQERSRKLSAKFPAKNLKITDELQHLGGRFGYFYSFAVRGRGKEGGVGADGKGVFFY